jgi:hypothetical protein
MTERVARSMPNADPENQVSAPLTCFTYFQVGPDEPFRSTGRSGIGSQSFHAVPGRGDSRHHGERTGQALVFRVVAAFVSLHQSDR